MQEAFQSTHILRSMAETFMDTEARKSFGARLKVLRQQRKWIQKEVAAQLGIKHTHYCKYEAGVYAPPIEKAVKLADIFGVTLDYLILGNEQEEAPVRNVRLAERFHAIEEFEREDQEMVVKLIDALIAKKHMERLAAPNPL